MIAFFASFVLLLCLFTSLTSALLSSFENKVEITIANAHLSFTIAKSTGAIHNLTLDNQNLLGTIHEDTPIPGGPTGNGRSGIGPYLDCYCIRNGTGNYTPGYIAPIYQTFNGTDATGTPFAGAMMEETFPSSGQILSMFWILSGEETGIHTFARIEYPKNPIGPTRQTLQEFRTLFRPNSDLWTHLSVNDDLASPLPKKESMKKAKMVQDATWDLSASEKDDPFVTEFSHYFTKYSFADTWREHSVHGLFGEATEKNETWYDLFGEEKDKTKEGTWGAWLVMNSRDTFYGGPGHSDLTVDGIVYNYMGK
jgi:rhamnogalacturonan endolyase